MSGYSQNLGLILPIPGDPAVANIWGTLLNTNDNLLDAAVGGTLNLSVAGNTNVILSSTAGIPDQSRNANFVFTGALTGNIIVFFPANAGRMFSVTNNTTGPYTLTIAVGTSVPAGATVAVPQTAAVSLASDGTNITSRANATGVGGLLAANNLSDVPNPSAARGNLSVPSDTGAGASGTWGIDISGNAATASQAESLNSSNDYAAHSLSLSAVLVVNSSITCNGDITAGASDDRLKDRKGPILGALDKVQSLSGFFYTYNDRARGIGLLNRSAQVGLSAQDVEKILPEAVRPCPADAKYLTLAYERLVPLLVEAIKELRAEVEELKGRK